MAIRKLARALAWGIGACVALAALAYVVVFAINWKDEAPSKEAIALERSFADKPDVPDAANAWFANLGLGAPEGSDTLALSNARKRYLAHYVPSKDNETRVLPGRESPYKQARPPAIAKLAAACRTGGEDCVRLVHGDFAQVDRWLASEQWLLERFERIETMHAWREVVPPHSKAPWPGVHHMINGQQLLLMQAWKQARAGDGEGARARLDRDFVFWRMVLRSADTMIVKVLAGIALERNLSVGNLVLRDLHAAGRAIAPPPSWAQALTREELSMRTVFATEYAFRSQAYRQLGAQANLSSANGFVDALLHPLYKPQATSNLLARDIAQSSAQLDVDPAHMRDAAQALQLQRSSLVPEPDAYNFYGHIVHEFERDAYLIDYALRVADTEGVRRAAMLAAELRAGAHAAPDVAVRDAQWKDPYTQAPFAWEPQSASIVFTGLAQGERKRHAIRL